MYLRYPYEERPDDPLVVGVLDQQRPLSANRTKRSRHHLGSSVSYSPDGVTVLIMLVIR